MPWPRGVKKCPVCKKKISYKPPIIAQARGWSKVEEYHMNCWVKLDPSLQGHTIQIIGWVDINEETNDE